MKARNGTHTVAAVVALALVMASPAVAVSQPKHATSFTESGSCSLEGSLEFMVDPADVRPFVPALFDLFDEGGRVLLSISSGGCTSTHRLGVALRDLGLPVDLVRGIDFEATESGPLVHIESDLGDFGYSPHSIAVTGAKPSFPVPPDGQEDIVFWALGTRGLVRRGYVTEPLSGGPGSGTITTEPGSPLFLMLGDKADPETGEARAPALTVAFDVSGTSELVAC